MGLSVTKDCNSDHIKIQFDTLFYVTNINQNVMKINT